MNLIYETLDLDFNSGLRLMRVRKTLEKLGARHVYIRVSPSGNGFHVKYAIPLENRDIARMVFDDARRFAADLKRQPETRNILWDEKTYYKAGKITVLLASVWVEWPTYPQTLIYPVRLKKAYGE